MIDSEPKTPFPLLYHWLKDAEAAEPNDPTAACLSTVGEDGFPNSRMVLIRRIEEKGLAFFTNLNSQKGRELSATPKAALCFHWKSLLRQVRIQGSTETVTAAEADDYFNARHRNSRIGAWASLQSSELKTREDLLGRMRDFEEKFKDLEHPPRPPHWMGFWIKPHRIEFWQQEDFRLHDRLVYIKAETGWTLTKLYP
jgi:pyridoxamine 5'-phosphate oxidase